MSPRTLRRPFPHARPARGPAPLALAVYGAVTLITLGLAYALGRSPLATDPWHGSLEPGGPTAHAISIGAGIALAAATILATRKLVRRWSWARALHHDLRPSIDGAGDATLLLLGIASAVAEELFFRGLLAPVVGLVVSAVAFGALHRLRGRAGLVWGAWATLMGLLFGSIFLATGSLFGAIVAHATINVANLRFLRDAEVEPPAPRRLGGLLGRT